MTTEKTTTDELCTAATAKTPAAEMAAAAQLLQDRVSDFRSEAAESPYWQGFASFADGVDNAMGGAGGKLAGLMSPNAAAFLSSLLRQTAKRWCTEIFHYAKGDWHQACQEYVEKDCHCFDHALAVARALNGGAP